MQKTNNVVFVEKKYPFNAEATHLCEDFQKNLNIGSVQNVRLINKYIITNIDQTIFKNSLSTIFSEPSVDQIYLNKFRLSKKEIAFGVELLPGQFNQRSDSAEQCIKLINPKSKTKVQSSTIYVIEGNLSIEQLTKIKKYCINPVDSHEVKPFDKKIINLNSKIKDVPTIHGFTKWNKDQLTTFYSEQKLAMSMNDLQLIQEYFINERRDPTETEIKVIDTYWSDHCRHTTFETRLQNIKIDDDQYSKPIKEAYHQYLESRTAVYGAKTTRKLCLMDLATIAAKELRRNGQLQDLDVSDENNACSINVDVKVDNQIIKYLLMFKNETHNHPTEIEPFGGAATCLGGAIRDPLSGRTYVYQAMRVTGAGDPTVGINKTLPHKLPQKTITVTAARGYSSYGNQIGLATGQVDEVYHPGYVAKRMEIGAVIGAAPKSNVVRKIPIKGDAIILLGGRTGKDGIGGATGSSKSHTTKSVSESGAEVQKGNPIVERKIQCLFKHAKVTKLIKKCNDFGAGGVSVAIGELYPGIDINLDAMPKKYLGLNGTELAISESQERMAVVVANRDAHKFITLANAQNLEATIVAKVTDTNRLCMFWNKKRIVNIARDFLDTNGAPQFNDVRVMSPVAPSINNCANIGKQWLAMLTDLNVCSKQGLIQLFDSTIGTNTVLAPLGGKYQATRPEGMAALIPTFGKPSSTASLMAYGFNPYLGEWSPFHMAYYSVIESVTKIVCMGGNWRNVRLSLQEYFQKLGKDSVNWGKPFAALLGAFTVQKALGLPAIGGKDSMSGSFEEINVPPTLVSFAVTTADAENIISPEFKRTGSTVVLVLPRQLNDGTIDLDVMKNNWSAINRGILTKQIISAYSLKQFGVAEGLTKMCLGNNIGVSINNMDQSLLFQTNYGGVILEIPDKFNTKKVLGNIEHYIIGTTIPEPDIIYKTIKFKLNINRAKELMNSKLAQVFVNKTIGIKANIEIPVTHVNQKRYSKKIVPNPLVIIPVFPGTNCEFDSQRAFEKAGAKVKQVIIRNMNAKILIDSINELSKAISQANILMIPGGFSASDEPDGSAKFIVNVFNNPKVKTATMNLLNKRDGLILGICNGFQALIKLGLLPYGKIQPATKDSPTLTYNKIHHHMSGIVGTKLVSNKSPWFNNLPVDSVRNVAISHGEGRFVATNEQVKTLIKQGQVATQYVDLQNRPTLSMPFNPNGSTYAVEGITSPDGRILGKMGHSERIGQYLYKNVPGECDQKIFESGVKYFTHKH